MLTVDSELMLKEESVFARILEAVSRGNLSEFDKEAI